MLHELISMLVGSYEGLFNVYESSEIQVILIPKLLVV